MSRRMQKTGALTPAYLDELRKAAVPVIDMHAEAFRPGQPTNYQRFLAALLPGLESILAEVIDARDDVDHNWTWYDSGWSHYDQLLFAIQGAADRAKEAGNPAADDAWQLALQHLEPLRAAIVRARCVEDSSGCEAAEVAQTDAVHL